MELRQHCRRDGRTVAWGHRARISASAGFRGSIPDPERWRDPSRVAEVASLGKGIAALGLEPELRSRRSSPIARDLFYRQLGIFRNPYHEA